MISDLLYLVLPAAPAFIAVVSRLTIRDDRLCRYVALRPRPDQRIDQFFLVNNHRHGERIVQRLGVNKLAESSECPCARGRLAAPESHITPPEPLCGGMICDRPWAIFPAGR